MDRTKKVTKIETVPELPTLKISKYPYKRVAAYARVSTDFEEQTSSFEAQIDYYTKMINKHLEWELVKIYSDEGISGTSTKHRAGFNEMIEDCEKGKIDLILTKSVSRFARNTVDSVEAIRRLKELDVEVFFKKENIWTLDSKGEFLLTLMSSLAQEESRSISENVAWAHRKRMADGKVSIPYSNFLGYDKGSSKYEMVVNEEEAKLVKRIYLMCIKGYTPVSIAKALTKEGIKSLMNKDSWSATTIRSVLSNEKYKGDALLQKNYTVDFLTKKQKVNNGEVPQYYVENNHEAVISPETFEIVQQEIQRRRNMNGKYSGVDILTAKIKCGECGGCYGAKVWHSNDKYRRVVYQCNRKYSGDKKCTTPIITKEDIENRFINVVNNLIKNKDEVIDNLETVKKTLCDTEELVKEKNKLQDQLVEQVEKIQGLIEVNSKVAQNQEDYQKKYDAIVKEYETTKAEHQKLELDISNKLAKSETLNLFINTIKKQDTLLKEFDAVMWGSLLESVTVYKADDIRFKFRDGTEIKG